jgi:ABC-type Fe3+/spermidine/putrescine transport system ATPase subunit
MRLTIEKLSQRTGDRWVLKDVTFSVNDGGIFGVFGPAGSGKTTLLKAIAGKVRHNGGVINLDRTDIAGMSASNRPVAYVSGCEPPSLITLLSRRGEIGSTGLRQAKTLRHALEETDGVLLLDEPFSHMDFGNRKSCFDQLRSASEKRMVIIASSDFEQIAALADNVAVLINGEIAQTGTPQAIYEKPETAAVAAITGENNIFAARRVSSSDADLPEFQTLDGSHRIFAQAVKKSRLGSIDQNVMLAIRPEQVALSVGASFPEDNLVKAIVSKVEFRGPTSLIHFDADGLSIKARVFKVVGVDVGDEFMLGLPPDRILVLKD